MQIRRTIGLVSLIFMIVIAISLYGPWDYLGLMDKYNVADTYIGSKTDVYVTGTIYHKEIKNDKPIYYVNDATISLGSTILKNTSFILYLDSDTIPNKSKITAYGKAEGFNEATNQGGFDQKKYYNSMGLSCKITANRVKTVKCPRLFSADVLYRFKKSIVEVYNRYLPNEEAGFISALVMGDKNNLDTELKELFSKVGVAHILAVSGLHISFICMGMYNIIRRLNGSYIVCAITSGTIAVLYGVMTGGSISSKRAIGMFIIYIFSQVLGESYDMITSLAIMADILIIENPLYLMNTGFIFSFSAVMGVHYIAKPLRKIYRINCDKNRENLAFNRGIQALYNPSFRIRVIEYFGGNLVFAFGITLSTLPLVEISYYQLPLYGLLVNAIVLPLMVPLLGLAIVGGLAGVIFPVLGEFFLSLCHYLIFLFEMIADLFSKLPEASIITGYPSMAKAILFYLGIWLCLHTRVIDKKAKNIFRSKIIVLGLLAIFMLVPKARGFEIDVVDVGQGDGIFFSCGKGKDCFIDGGSTSEKKVGEYTIIPFLKYKGIRDIDYWFITHGDEDHVSGLIYAIEDGYKINNIVLSQYVVETQEIKNIKKLANEQNINIKFMKAKDSIVLNKTRITCLYPNKTTGDDPNSMSLSLIVENRNMSAFFGGDLGSAQESELAKYVGHVDYLKVSHHGSKNSSCEAFLKALTPKIATISCAKINSYGHPAKSAIARIESVGTKIYYTMYNGQIIIKPKGNGINVKTYRQ